MSVCCCCCDCDCDCGGCGGGAPGGNGAALDGSLCQLGQGIISEVEFNTVHLKQFGKLLDVLDSPPGEKNAEIFEAAAGKDLSNANVVSTHFRRTS